MAGAAGLSVDLATLAGQLDFTGLEYWDDAEPAAVGSGSRFGSGVLNYTVQVSGNTFAQTGGDAGIVTGAFLGQGHEEMGGVLKRDDLTAAFGGSR